MREDICQRLQFSSDYVACRRTEVLWQGNRAGERLFLVSCLRPAGAAQHFDKYPAVCYFQHASRQSLPEQDAWRKTCGLSPKMYTALAPEAYGHPTEPRSKGASGKMSGGGGGPLGLRPFSYPSHPTPVNATIRAFLQSTDPCRAGTRGFQDLCGLCLRTNHSLLGCVDGFGLVNSFERHKTSRISKASCCLAASSSGSPAGAYRSHPLDRPLQTHAGAGRRLQVGLCRKAIHDPTPGSRRSSATARQWRVCRTASTRVESFHRPRR